MVQHSVPGHLDQVSSSKRGSGCHTGFFTEHSSMDNYFSNSSLEVIEMFRIKDNFIYYKDFCLIFKDFSRKNQIQVLFKPNINFQRLFKTVRTMQTMDATMGLLSLYLLVLHTILTSVLCIRIEAKDCFHEMLRKHCWVAWKEHMYQTKLG